MTNRIDNDNYLAHSTPKQRKTGSAQTNQDAAGQQVASPPPADVERAQQRLLQETGDVRPPAVDTPTQARARIALLKEQLAADPKLAMQAHGRVNVNQFEAATARPSA